MSKPAAMGRSEAHVVLITGCSSGIGRATAELLQSRGHLVVATARDPGSLAGLNAAGKLRLDVTDDRSVADAVAAVVAEHGRIDALVNNAGYGIQGAVEEVPVADAAAMFDVNVFGVRRMVRAVAPLMRARRRGHIINVSSIAGRLSTPANGTYAASKFGVEVSVIEPGAVATRFDETVGRLSRGRLSDPDSPYRPLYDALTARRPRARYLAGATASSAAVLAARDLVWGPATRRLFRFEPRAGA